MRTVVLGTPPPALAELIEQRRHLGQDIFDEVWDGEYHVAPGPSAEHGRVDDELTALLRPRALAVGLVGTGPFNLGTAGDYRVPDGGLHRGRPTGVYLPTAAVVVEIVSPDDETYDKFGFYAAHSVDELVAADPGRRLVEIWRLTDGRYSRVERSGVLDIAVEELTGGIDWP